MITIRHVAAAAALFASFVLQSFAQAQTNPIINVDQVNYSTLDYGLYFLNTERQGQKFSTSGTNSFFDRTKPTLIYIHGWQNGATQGQRRETFDRSRADTSDDFAQIWRSKGWNVGICYWNQFADEGEVKDAEAKVWVANGPRAMRWRKADGSYENGPAKSAGTLCYEALKPMLSNFTGSQLRLAGHSLGSQMVINVGNLLSEAVDRGELTARARPKRIALLDPAFLKDARSYLNNRWTGEVARAIVATLKTKGVIFEAYRSSGSTSTGFIGDTNYELLKMTAFTELVSSYYAFWDFGAKHEHAVWHYLWSMKFAPPPVDRGNLPPLHPADVMAVAPSAATEDYRIAAQQNSTLRFQHDSGRSSKTPSDDDFTLANK